MHNSKFTLVAIAAAAGFVGLAYGNFQAPETREHRELHATASVVAKIAACERRGFQADLGTGECTDIPQPAVVR